MSSQSAQPDGSVLEKCAASFDTQSEAVLRAPTRLPLRL
jgi:hypothetical protein